MVIAHKIVSKAEGRSISLEDVAPSDRAYKLAEKVRKDPRKVELILRESNRIVRAQRHEGKDGGILICEHRLGFVSANAAVDESNATEAGTVILLPQDPDDSARRIRDAIAKATGVGIGVVITDSFGRPWRLGIVNVAVGLAGVPALKDLRGEIDCSGRKLSSTVLAVADELAAASGLIMGKTERTPAVIIRGFRWREVRSSAKELVRESKEDLFQ
jgi:coenzyme F420-0:L-glutamate ligase/coenzyme F420-1:gamma-L-glutamate ligase